MSEVMRAAGLAVALVAATTFAAHAQPRDPRLSEVRGNSGINTLPLLQAAADNVGRMPGMAKPNVSRLPTQDTVTRFCQVTDPLEESHLFMSARRMRAEEFKNCFNHGVRDIIELRLGRSAIALVNGVDTPVFDMTTRDLYVALAAQVPHGGKLEKNNFASWKDVNKKFPDLAISVLVPIPASGLRPVFDGLVMQDGCRGINEVDAIFSVQPRVAACTTLRTDGKVVEAAGHTQDALQRIADPKQPTIGFVSMRVLQENGNVVHAFPINGVKPTVESIQREAYPLTLSVYAYVKRDAASRLPALRALMTELTSERAIGPSGYMVAQGITPLSEEDRRQVRRDAHNLRKFSR
jgi:phosphate transport system substrate-binding protein